MSSTPIPNQGANPAYDALTDDLPSPDAKGEFASPLEGALFMAGKEIPQIPLKPKSKIPCISDWPTAASADPIVIREWAEKFPNCNFGSVSVLGSHFAFETDSTEVRKRFGGAFSSQLVVESRRGGHRYYAFAPGITNISQADVQHKDFSVRADREFCVSPGSIHPDTGKQYRVKVDGDLVKPTQEEIAFWNSERTSNSKSAESVSDSNKVIVEGGRNDGLTSLAGKLRRDGCLHEEIELILLRRNLELCQPPLGDEEVRTIARSVARYEIDDAPTLLLNGAEPGTRTSPSQDAASATPLTVRSGKISIPYSDDVFHGLAGRIIRKLQPETESHPVGNLLELLIGFGSIIGPTAYYKVEDDRHFANLYGVIVGQSSKGRKGTGRGRIHRVLESLDQQWFDYQKLSGFGSGEAVVWQIRDEVTRSVRGDDGAFRNVVIDPGVQDKRLFISEGEFSSVLTVASRKDSILSSIIRNGWDHKSLSNIVKGAKVVCKDPHISISADVTAEELAIQLKESDKFNGFANRFLWCLVERQGLKPHGGEEIDWSKEIVELFDCVVFARQQKRIFMDRNARETWERMYREFSENRVIGAAGSATSRSEPQTLRIALIYALLDKSEHIRPEHLKAAFALWQYCEDSARIIFGGVRKEHERIVDFIRSGPKTMRELQDTLYRKNRRVEEIQADLDTLIATAKAYSKLGHDGVECFYLIGA